MEVTSLAIIIVLCAMTSAQHPPLIIRPNIGVIMLQERELSLSPSTWHHTIAIPFFPELPMTSPSMSCTSGKDNFTDNEATTTCGSLRELNTLYSHLKTRMTSDIRDAHTAIMDVMTFDGYKSRRTRRGWFNLLGNIAKKVMGVATEEDIRILQGHITELMSMIRNDKKDRIHDVSKLHSYEVKSDLRMNRLQKHLIRLDQTLIDMSNDLATLQNYAQFAESIATQVKLQEIQINTTKTLMVWLHHYNINLHTLAQLRISVASQIADINQLIKGRLTINLVDPQHLRSILKDINSELQSKSKNLYIKPEIARFYKFNNMVTSTHDDKFLYVKIKIPVSSPTTEFTLYRIDTIPVPTASDNSIFTILTGFNVWFAISTDSKYFIEIPDKEVHLLKDELNIRNYLPTKPQNTSCPFALFKGDTKAILQLCQHRVMNRPTITSEFVYTIPTQGYLVYTPARVWTLQCHNSNKSTTQTLSHKGLFKINIQCGCHLSSHLTELLADSDRCAPTESITTYSANYLVYAKLYQESITLNITIDDFTTTPYDFELPHLLHSKLNFSDLELGDGLSTEDQTDLDNFDISDTTEDLSWTFGSWRTMPEADTIVASAGVIITAIVIASTMVLLHHHRQLNRINTILISLATVQATEISKISLPSTTVLPTPESPTNDLPIWRTVIICISFGLSVINMIIILVDKLTPLFKKCEPSTRLQQLETELYCAMYSHQHNIHIKITTIPHDMSILSVMKIQDPHEVRFSSCFLLPRAIFDWAQLQIYAGESRIILPTSVNLPPCQFGAYRNMARHCHTIRFILVQATDTFVIASWSKDETAERRNNATVMRFNDPSGDLNPRPARREQDDQARAPLMDQPGINVPQPTSRKQSDSSTGSSNDPPSSSNPLSAYHIDYH